MHHSIFHSSSRSLLSKSGSESVWELLGLLPGVFFMGGVALVGVSSLDSEELEMLSVSDSSASLLDSSVSLSESTSWPSASEIFPLPPEPSPSELPPSNPLLSSGAPHLSLPHLFLQTHCPLGMLSCCHYSLHHLRQLGTRVWSPGSGCWTWS